jgi:hypothetical protein
MRKRARRISYVFEKKKEGQRTYNGQYRNKASPSFRRYYDKQCRWDLLFLWWDYDRGAVGL